MRSLKPEQRCKAISASFIILHFSSENPRVGDFKTDGRLWYLNRPLDLYEVSLERKEIKESERRSVYYFLHSGSPNLEMSAANEKCGAVGLDICFRQNLTSYVLRGTALVSTFFLSHVTPHRHEKTRLMLSQEHDRSKIEKQC